MSSGGRAKQMCRYGDECRIPKGKCHFLHPRDLEAEKNICKEIKQKPMCRYGDECRIPKGKCHFSHPRDFAESKEEALPAPAPAPASALASMPAPAPMSVQTFEEFNPDTMLETSISVQEIELPNPPNLTNQNTFETFDEHDLDLIDEQNQSEIDNAINQIYGSDEEDEEENEEMCNELERLDAQKVYAREMASNSSLYFYGHAANCACCKGFCLGCARCGGICKCEKNIK